jgi:hypothetical protein
MTGDNQDDDESELGAVSDDAAPEEIELDLNKILGISVSPEEALARSRKYVSYTIKLPSEQLAALQSIWLELKRLYGAHSPDKSGIIQQAITEWLKRWDGPEKAVLLRQLLEIRQNTRRRQYRKE